MKKVDKNKFIRRTISILFWIGVWQLLSSFIKSEILVASPINVAKAFFELITTIDLWSSIAFSFIRIIGGFFIALIFGMVLAVLSSYSRFLREIIYVPMTIIKATPVASFIIIALVWINARNLSIFISFLMVLPVIYTNVMKGIENIDIKMKEMLSVFKVSFVKRLRYVYIPSIMPFLISAINISMGMGFKAGIAAEIIGIPTGSIGEKLYQAKIFLNTPELFAWTIIIILISVCFERVFLIAINNINRRLLGGFSSGN